MFTRVAAAKKHSLCGALRYSLPLLWQFSNTGFHFKVPPPLHWRRKAGGFQRIGSKKKKLANVKNIGNMVLFHLASISWGLSIMKKQDFLELKPIEGLWVNLVEKTNEKLTKKLLRSIHKSQRNPIQKCYFVSIFWSIIWKTGTFEKYSPKMGKYHLNSRLLLIHSYC